MSKKLKQDELTTKMHSEFSVSEETEKKHVVFTALKVIDSKVMTKSKAMAVYAITQADVKKYQEEWNNLNES
jgi:hypothetical protein